MLLKASEADLRAAGLSFRKIEYLQGLAEAELSGALGIKTLGSLSDEEAIERIVQLRGFGRWSAEIYLMFSLDRRDIFPADDLALQVALGRLRKLDHRPTAGESRKLTESWAPYRTAASLFCGITTKVNHFEQYREGPSHHLAPVLFQTSRLIEKIGRC